MYTACDRCVDMAQIKWFLAYNDVGSESGD